MSGVPVETVVDEITVNRSTTSDGMLWVVKCVNRKYITAADLDELRTKVREYLLTLVPKPVMLSECEEGKEVEVEWSIKAHRDGDDAFAEDDRWIGNASNIKVIQPVEVK